MADYTDVLERLAKKELVNEQGTQNTAAFTELLESKANIQAVKYATDKYLEKYLEKKDGFVKSESDANILVDNFLTLSAAWAEEDELKSKATPSTDTNTAQDKTDSNGKVEVKVDKSSNVGDAGSDNSGNSTSPEGVIGVNDFNNLDPKTVPKGYGEWVETRQRRNLGKPVDCSNLSWERNGIQ